MGVNAVENRKGLNQQGKKPFGQIFRIKTVFRWSSRWLSSSPLRLTASYSPFLKAPFRLFPAPWSAAWCGKWIWSAWPGAKILVFSSLPVRPCKGHQLRQLPQLRHANCSHTHIGRCRRDINETIQLNCTNNPAKRDPAVLRPWWINWGIFWKWFASYCKYCTLLCSLLKASKKIGQLYYRLRKCLAPN